MTIHYPTIALCLSLFVHPTNTTLTTPVLIHHNYRRTVNTIGRADEMLNESSQGEAALVLASMFALVAGKDGDFSADELADAEELRTGALLIFNAEDSGMSERSD